MILPRETLSEDEVLEAATAIAAIMGTPGWKVWETILRRYEHEIGIHSLEDDDGTHTRKWWRGYRSCLLNLMGEPEALLAKAKEIKAERDAAGKAEKVYVRRPLETAGGDLVDV